MLSVLSLCSGIGGLDLGVKWSLPSARTVAYIEVDPFCQAVLAARMRDRWLDSAPIWPDIRTFDAVAWRGVVDCVIAGFPCQPFSVAGKRRGADDPRNLWPDVRRVVAESEPKIVFLENVPGAMPYFFHVVLPELQNLGYRTTAGLFTAAEVGAPHRRQRLYVLAGRPQGDRVADAGCRGDDTDQSGREGGARGSPAAGAGRRRAPMAPSHLQHADGRRDIGAGRGPVSSDGREERGDSDRPRLEGPRQPERPGADELPAWPPGPEERDRWVAILARRPNLAPATAQPSVRRVADGTAHRVDRLRALGNAVVPQAAATALTVLIEQLSAASQSTEAETDAAAKLPSPLPPLPS